MSICVASGQTGSFGDAVLVDLMWARALGRKCIPERAASTVAECACGVEERALVRLIANFLEQGASLIIGAVAVATGDQRLPHQIFRQVRTARELRAFQHIPIATADPMI